MQLGLDDPGHLRGADHATHVNEGIFMHGT